MRPIFLSFFLPVGVFLLIAAKKPSAHRSMIALAPWWNLSHSAVMAIQTVQARLHGVHRDFTDEILFLVIGLALLALLPPKQNALSRRALHAPTPSNPIPPRPRPHFHIAAAIR